MVFMVVGTCDFSLGLSWYFLGPSEAPLTCPLLPQLCIAMMHLFQVSIVPVVLVLPEIHVPQNLPGSLHRQSLQWL